MALAISSLIAIPATLAFGLMGAQFTEAAVTDHLSPQAVIPVSAPPPQGSQAESAQLLREHMRALAANDPANDPLDSTSSDQLNQQQLAAVQVPAGSGQDTSGQTGADDTQTSGAPAQPVTPPDPNTQTSTDGRL